MIPAEHSVDLRSLEAFTSFSRENAWFRDMNLLRDWVERIRSVDVVEPLTGEHIEAGKLDISGDNYRETLSHQGVCSRHRALMATVGAFIPTIPKPLSKIDFYMPEAVTPFAARMARVFPKFVGSEYTTDKSVIRLLNGVRIEDLMVLSFEDESFDIVASNDVLEHVPSIDASLREMMRILRPGGVMISTHPFAAGSAEPVKFAEIVNGELVHHQEPQYHGNPVDPKGSLVFEVPGWDIVPRCLAAGATDAFVRIAASQRHAYVGAHEAGIYLTVAIK